jgi:hypothetical protein
MTDAYLFFSVYCNSLLGTLNVRKAIDGRVQADLCMSMRVFDDPGSPATDNDKVGVLVRLLLSLIRLLA